MRINQSFLKEEKNNPLWIAFLNTGESTPSFWCNFTSQLDRLDETVSANLKALGFPADIPQTEKVLSLLNNVIFPSKTVLVIEAIDMLKQLEEDISPLNNSIFNTTIDS